MAPDIHLRDRQDGSPNGNWGEVDVYYSTTAAKTTYTKLKTVDLGMSWNATRITLGDNGIDDVYNVRFVVRTAYASLVTAAEVQFYQTDNSLTNYFASIFADNLCTTLRSGVSPDTITNAFAKQLATTLAAGGYSTAYRVGEFEAYETLNTLRTRLKVSRNYNAYENPTGIYFTKGTPIVIFAEGIGDYPVNLVIKSFGKLTADETQPQSSYVLRNGINVITPQNRGNGYISYYTNDYNVAPKVKMHFALADENGYFDLERDDNEVWKNLLANAKSDILDVRSKRFQGAYPVARLRTTCPNDGVALLTHSDSTIYYERQILGLQRFGLEPKNRQFARVVWSGFMFADGYGAAANDGSVSVWLNPNASAFEFWGFAHELGHVNQVTPDFNYAGLGETSNNIYSAWVQFKLSTANYYRLESEITGVNDYRRMKGGRFQTYLEENVRKGVAWQLADGPDYNGTTPNQVTVRNEDYEGNVLSQDTLVATRNYDHFVKLAPLWQLQLFCDQVGFSPEIYGRVYQGMREETISGTASSGKYQLRFIKLVCDSTGYNFLPFFEKAGMLRPVNAYIQDYSPDWLKINQKMIDDLKAYVAGKGYGEIEAEVNYITALNWRIYKDKADLVAGSLNEGTTAVDATRVRVNHSTWQNAVAFETYDAAGNLLRISMMGLGGDTGNTYTQVLFPVSEGASYIMAVGWNGRRVKCYQP